MDVVQMDSPIVLADESTSAILPQRSASALNSENRRPGPIMRKTSHVNQAKGDFRRLAMAASEACRLYN